MLCTVSSARHLHNGPVAGACRVSTVTWDCEYLVKPLYELSQCGRVEVFTLRLQCWLVAVCDVCNPVMVSLFVVALSPLVPLLPF